MFLCEFTIVHLKPSWTFQNITNKNWTDEGYEIFNLKKKKKKKKKTGL